MMNNKLFLPVFCLLSLFFWAACDLERIEPGGPSGTGTKFSTTVGGSSNDFPNDIITASDGGFVVAGYTQSFGNGNQAYIVKVDKNGAQQWENNFGGAFDDYATAVTASSDGGFVLCGRTWDVNQNQDLLIVKVNSTGGKVWEKTYGATDSTETAFGIVPVGTGDFLIGYTVSGGVDLIRLLRVNSNGSKVSDKTVRTGDFGIKKMIKTSDGKIVMAGDKYSTTTVSYILKLNEDGSYVWENTYPSSAGNNYTPGYGVAELTDKSLVMCSSDLGNNTSDHDFNLSAFNSIGGNLWDETWGGASADELFDVARSSDNELGVAGYTASFSGTTEIYLSKRKSIDGSKIWEKNFFAINNGWVSMAACSDGGFVVCAAQNQANGDIIIVKTDKDGNYQ
ncbi:MAG: hypothetical protein IT262_08090 [Saprospiraceae bacterium]|nr:hypothetical protein [Saprospiraceae bacterium]